MKSARKSIGSLIILLFAATPLLAQDATSISLRAFGGFQNTPAHFDVVRSVAYDGIFRFGGGLTLAFNPFLSLRADFSFASNDGRDTGLVNESVSFTRSYYMMKLQLNYPVSAGITPYVFGGGGIVQLERRADSYSYNFAENAAVFGTGIEYQISSFDLAVFVEGEGFLYPRQTIGGLQFDKAANIGISYVLTR